MGSAEVGDALCGRVVFGDEAGEFAYGRRQFPFFSNSHLECPRDGQLDTNAGGEVVMQRSGRVPTLRRTDGVTLRCRR
jgi:hypothetical protein